MASEKLVLTQNLAVSVLVPRQSGPSNPYLEEAKVRDHPRAEA